MSDFADFMAEIPHEGDPIEMSEVSPTEASKTEAAPSQAEQPEPKEGQAKQEQPAEEKPFVKKRHEYRWKKLNAEIQALRKENEEFKAKHLQPQESRPAAPPRVPAELADIFGDNADSYSKFEAYTKTLTEKQFQDLMERREQEQKAATEREKAALAEYQEKYEEQLAELGEELGLELDDPKSNERNQILKIVEEEGIYDAEGNPNFRLANKIRLSDERYTPKSASKERKRVAANTGPSDLTDAPKGAEVMTPKKLRSRSFSSYLFN